MYKIVNKTLFAFFILSGAFNCVQAITFEDQKKSRMIQDLEVIKHHFEAGYAPAQWKKEYAGWDLNEAFESAKNQILTTPSITTKQFHQIVRTFINSMKDYHVDVSFFSTESASLPFSVKGIDGRYFIDWVDPLRLPLSYYGLRAGDELLEFNERPIAEVIDELEKVASKSSNPNTDKALAAMKLTIRYGMAGDSVPKGSILVKTKSVKNGKITVHQLCWAYKPEHVKNPFDFIQTLDFLSWLPYHKQEKPKIELMKIVMATPLHQELAKEYAGRDGALGGRKSFLPPFGEIIWSNEKKKDGNQDIEHQEGDSTDKGEGKEEKKDEPSFWHAYIYRHPQGYQIGYIRIPHYLVSMDEIKEFGKIINMMDENTDALVIDQVHNFGGFVHIQYILASILTNHPLQAPYHRIKITQKDVLDAYETLELIKLIEMTTAFSESEDQTSESKEEETGLNFQELLFLKAYCELILEDWNKGQTLTSATPILGVDKINPHPKYRYSKPILMLINEMDFSGGDFMPAILQDNQRALLFGARTAGAGGYVFTFQFPNTNGIAFCSYTASIAERLNNQKIENLGVTPDIPYQVTLDDVQSGYRGYIEAANQTINTLLESKVK